MSLPLALQFIHRVRNDDSLRHKLRDLGDDATLYDIVALAASVGLDFTAEELQKAHKYDWGMRWARYQPRDDMNSQLRVQTDDMQMT